MSANPSPDIPEPGEGQEVAFGDRHGEVRYEPDPDQLVRARYLVRPEGPLPPHEHSAAQERGDLPPSALVEDVLVAPDVHSVWDARPVTGPDDER